MESHTPEYLRTAQAAQYLSVSRQYLESTRRRGDGPPLVRLGRTIRYRRAALDAWMKNRESRPRFSAELSAENYSRRGKRHVETFR